MTRPKVFALHPVDQIPQSWPPHPMLDGHPPANGNAPPLAYYYSSPRNSDDSSFEEGPFRGRPSYLRPRRASTSSDIRFTKKRRATDLFFLFTFLLFFGFLGYTLFDTIVIRKTNPNLVLHGYDNWGNVCGQKNAPIQGVPYSGQNMFRKPFLLIYFESNSTMNKICVENCNEVFFIKTTFNRCLPRQSELQPLMNTVNYTRSFVDAIASDLIACLNEIAILFGLSFLMTLILVVLIRYMASFIIWLTLIALGIAAVLLTTHTWVHWYTLKNQQVSSKDSGIVVDSNYDQDEENNLQRWFMYSLIASAVTTCFLLVMLVMRKRIQLVCMLFKEAGKAIGAMPSLLLQPIFTLLTLSIITFSWLIGTLFLMSNRQPIVDIKTGFVVYSFDSFYKYVKWINIFAFLWAVYFVAACQHFVIAASVAKWFFARDKERLNFPIIGSTFELIRYHLGSVALGSLLVAGMKIVRLLFKKVETLTSKTKDSCGNCSKIFHIFFYIFEKFLIYLNKNAYIVMAIHGSCFSKSAQRAFSILSSNTLRIAAINSVGDFLLLLGKILIVICTAIVGNELIREKSEKLNYPWSPILIAVIFSYFISHCFLAVYEMTIDTLFICFCEECHDNEGAFPSFSKERKDRKHGFNKA